MTSGALPDGVTTPGDGALPAWVASSPSGRGFGVYLHVPFCAVRCGYCDFTTYTASDLGDGARQSSYAATAVAEVELAGRVLADAGRGERAVDTVFVGGGTPTVLPPDDLVRMLDAVRTTWGLAQGAEVTTEANPDSVTQASIARLGAGGFTRISFGMQSAVPHVLATLERTHEPRRVPEVVRWARDVGLATSLDLIYGTPGESVDDWRRSIDAALECGVDHISAYALVVEPGTRMGARIRRGELPEPDPDDEATKYEVADEMLAAAGLSWYEVSNWARADGDVCRHNLGYWHGADWWGIGPGAHSHVAAGDRAVRWWNVKHPRAYADALGEGRSPAAGRELLDADDTRLERVLLGIRLSEGLDLAVPAASGRRAVAQLVADGLLDGVAAVRGRAVLTVRGRLLADTVVRTLTV